jgi:uncharacterized protein (DUF2147 family)
MKRFKLSMLLLAALLFAVGQVVGQDVVGKWKTIDDESGNQKSIVQLWMISGKLYGKVLQTWDDDGVTPTDKLCDKCTGANKDKRVIGMTIVLGLDKSGEIWKGKKGILDPKKGTYYDVKIWLEDPNTLTVRGSIGPIGRKQTWHRVTE